MGALKMAKRLFLLLCVNLMMVLSPWFLTAADTMSVVGVDDSRAVETVIPPEPEPESVVASTVVTASAPVTPRVVNYTVSVVTDEIVGENLNYSSIYRTGKFIYAHNSSNLFGNLKNLNYDDIFTITEAGVTRTYQVMDKAVYEKAENGYLNGSRSLTKAVEIGANGYDISIMTCSGAMYRNGDVSHRLVVFANAA